MYVGLNDYFFNRLLSPTDQYAVEDGTIETCAVNPIVNACDHAITFCARLICRLFITHRWESDSSLQDSLLSDIAEGNCNLAGRVKGIQNKIRQLSVRLSSRGSISKDMYRLNKTLAQKCSYRCFSEKDFEEDFRALLLPELSSAQLQKIALVYAKQGFSAAKIVMHNYTLLAPICRRDRFDFLIKFIKLNMRTKSLVQNEGLLHFSLDASKLTGDQRQILISTYQADPLWDGYIGFERLYKKIDIKNTYHNNLFDNYFNHAFSGSWSFPTSAPPPYAPPLSHSNPYQSQWQCPKILKNHTAECVELIKTVLSIAHSENISSNPREYTVTRQKAEKILCKMLQVADAAQLNKAKKMAIKQLHPDRLPIELKDHGTQAYQYINLLCEKIGI